MTPPLLGPRARTAAVPVTLIGVMVLGLVPGTGAYAHPSVAPRQEAGISSAPGEPPALNHGPRYAARRGARPPAQVCGSPI